MAEQDKNWWQTHRLQAIRLGVGTLAILGGLRARLIYIALALVIIIWLVVARVLVVLQAETVLPAGVSPQNPTLERQLLESIEQSRKTRTTTIQTSYEAYGRYFVIPSPAP